MPSFEHKKLIEKIQEIDTPPDGDIQFNDWIKAEMHLKFLEDNARSNEIIVYGAGPHTFAHTVAVPNQALARAKTADLLHWSGNPYKSIASYVWGGTTKDLRIERDNHDPFSGSKDLTDVTDLVFGRTFEGWKGVDRNYFEVNQEYAHLAGTHYRPEHRSYCRFDDNRDLVHAVSISMNSGDSGVTLVTFRWDILEKYLAASNMSLVRLFDLTLLRKGSFSGWETTEESIIERSPDFKFRQAGANQSCYSRGYQIVRIRAPREKIVNQIVDGWFGKEERQYCEFIAHDWRNNTICKISTDPKATTSYFVAKNNDLPFELSPAFFRPEVLSKYKTDRDKYTVGDREVSCRSSWHLRGVDVNEAGQVHAYICDLRQLPYSEQLHWLSYNEEPKSKISDRAFTSDFEGQFVSYTHPRNEILSKLRVWSEKGTWWWALKDKNLLDRANPPLTSSTDEWADAYMDLSKLIVEGFNTTAIRAELDRQQVAFQKDEQSLALLEKLLSKKLGSPVPLSGIRKAHRIRSKVKGHAGAGEGQELAAAAISEHGSYAEHFKAVCQQISDELTLIGDNLP
jgi:hypothetical protein